MINGIDFDCLFVLSESLLFSADKSPQTKKMLRIDVALGAADRSGDPCLASLLITNRLRFCL